MELRIVLGSSSRRTRRPGAGRDPMCFVVPAKAGIQVK